MIHSERDLVHKNEKRYFMIALLVSLLTYIGLFLSIVGIIYAAIFISISMFLHALSLASIRLNGVRLNEEQFPHVYEKVKELCTKMEMSSVPDVYVVESSGILNAFATRFFGRNMVVLYSELFELMNEGSEEELTFVIAHELAHIKRRHISKQFLVLPAMWIPGITQAYSRACEFTCDRYAAYYTQNSEAAKKALTIFGVGKRLFEFINRNSYLNQVQQEHGLFIWLSEKLSTHPPLPKRIREISNFMQDHEQEPLPSSKSWIIFPTLLLVLFLVIGGAIQY